MYNLSVLEDYCEQLRSDAERKVEWTLSDHIPLERAVRVRNSLYAVADEIEEVIAGIRAADKYLHEDDS